MELGNTDTIILFITLFYMEDFLCLKYTLNCEHAKLFFTLKI